MAIKDTLLKECMADAQELRESAIANAQLTLSESFRPTITKMLAQHLREEDESDTEDMDEQKKLDSSGIGGGAVTADSPGPKEPAAAAKDSSDIDNPGLVVKSFGEGIQDLHPHELPPHDPQGAANEYPQANDHTFGEEEGGEGELDLEAIIRELEAELMGQGGEQEDPNAGAPPAAPVAPKGPPAQEGFDDVKCGQETDGPVRIRRNETVEDAGGGDAGVFKDGEKKATVDGVPAGKKVTPGQEVDDGEYGTKAEGKQKDPNDDDDKEIDLDEILREIEAESVGVNEANIATENAKLRQSLKEHREVIKLQRSRINEVALLNSKLLYTTKVFRAFTLTESQKRRVVDQFDRAKNLREAKLIYTTLAESLLNKSGNDSSKRVAARITEGASGVIGSTKSRSQEVTILTEGDEQISRLQKLAGITPSKK